MRTNKWLNECKGCEHLKVFIKGRWVPFAASIFILGLLFFLYRNGFRITYAPTLESSWDAVSAFAAWGGVLASFLAIWFAVQIPKKIADRQDKISIFDKRMQCYRQLQKHMSFCKVMSEKKSPIDVFEWAFLDCLHTTGNYKEMIIMLQEVSDKLYQIPFLFSNISEEDIDEIYYPFLHLTKAIFTQENIDDTLQRYRENIFNFQEKHMQDIRKSLELN